VLWFSFDGPTADGLPTSWRGDLVCVLRAFEGCARPDDVVLAAGELVSNGVEHGGGVRRLHVDGRRGVVTVEVEDYRSSLTTLRDVGARPEGGRGLRIVDAVADDWGWWPTESGKTVWATFLPELEEEDS
jgi:anti-sigma regulatory factor (Ser/Thr protein kinase)